jgi:AraC family transcriptional regulator
MEDQLAAIGRALDYIERHLKDKILVEDMADACGYSLFYFIRLFNQCVHLTPYDYLIRRRLAQAARELLDSDRRVLDIAVDYGFQSAEAFTRAFNRIFGTQPSQARKNGFIDARVMLPPCSREQLMYYRENGIPEAQQCSLPQMLLSGLVLDADLTPGQLGRMTAHFRAVDSTVREIFWVRTALTGPLGSQFTNFAGIVTPDWTEIPRESYAKRLPAGRYACFRQPRLMENLEHVRDYVYHSWLANTAEKANFQFEICRLSFEEGSWSAQLILPLFNISTAPF